MIKAPLQYPFVGRGLSNFGNPLTYLHSYIKILCCLLMLRGRLELGRPVKRINIDEDAKFSTQLSSSRGKYIIKL